MLNTHSVRSINHPLCGCAVKVIPKNHLFQYNVVVQATLSERKVILWQIKQIVLHIQNGCARIYENGTKYQRTRDHSLVQILCDTGEIRESEIRTHEDRNTRILLQSQHLSAGGI